MTARRWRVRWPAAALIAGLALAGGSAAGYALTRPPGHDYGTVPSPDTVASSHSGPADRPAATHRSGTAEPPAAAPAVTAVQVPVRLLIPAIGVNAPVLPTGVQAGGALAIPPDPADVGWWAGGGFPGEPTGAVVLVGHINSAVSGPGALLRLQDVRPGTTVTVTAAGHAYRYRVVALRAYAKTSLPVTAIFGQQVTARLVVVSCGGPFDPTTGHYLDNIVAYAVPAGQLPVLEGDDRAQRSREQQLDVTGRLCSMRTRQAVTHSANGVRNVGGIRVQICDVHPQRTGLGLPRRGNAQRVEMLIFEERERPDAGHPGNLELRRSQYAVFPTVMVVGIVCRRIRESPQCDVKSSIRPERNGVS